MSRSTTSYKETCLSPVLISNPPTPTGTLPCGAVTGGGPDGGPGGPDTNCNDPIYAAAHPSICGSVVTLTLAPSQASVVINGMIQYSSVLIQNGVQIPVSLGLLYSSSDTGIATINATTGLATGINPGVVTVTVTWHTLTAFAQLTVVDSCTDVTSDFVIVVDNSKSMSQAFDINYVTKFAFAKAAVRSFAATINYATDRVAVVDFNTAFTTISGFSTSAAVIDAALAGLPQTQNYTTIHTGIKAAFDLLATSTASRRVVLLVSDGEDRPPTVVTGDTALDIALAFTGAGGLFMSLGVRAYGGGYKLMSDMASGGFFLNAYAGNSVQTITTLNTFTGYICSNNGGGYVLTAPNPQSPDPIPLPDLEPTISGPGGPNEPPPTTYSYTATATAYCPGNDVGDPATASITYISSISPADAQSHAQVQAQSVASSRLNCCRNGPINIPALGAASPNPACYKVAGFSGTVTGVEVVLDDLSHDSFSDIEAVLVSPQGQAAVILRKAGQAHVNGNLQGVTVHNLQMTFADGSPSLAVDVPVVTGTWAPTDTLPSVLPSNPLAPQTVLGHSLSVFNGIDPNGVWHLYVYDLLAPDAGSIGSWFIVINGVAVCACAGSPNNLAIHGGAGGLSQLALCGSLATSSNPVWDGTGITRTSGCLWQSPILYSVKSVVGKKMYQVKVELISLGGQCYYEMNIYSNNVSSIWWRGRKAGSFGSGPAGVYNIVPAGCSNAVPLTIQLDAA